MNFWSENCATELATSMGVRIISQTENTIIFEVDGHKETHTVTWTQRKAGKSVTCTCPAGIYSNVKDHYNCQHKKAVLIWWGLRRMWRKHRAKMFKLRFE